jgi:NADH-quinone oxidoreductase subunit L
MPITAATFLVGSAALSGVAPFAGFFSKDEILAALHARAWPAAHGDHHAAAAADGPFQLARFATDSTHTPGVSVGLDALDRPETWQILFWMSLVTAGLTAFYTFRAVFMTFTGPTRVPEGAHGHGHSHDAGHTEHAGHDGHGHDSHAGHGSHLADSYESPWTMTLPLVLLAIPSALIGWLLFSTNWLSHFLSATPSLTAPAVASTATPHVFHMNLAIQGTLAAAIGIVIAAIGHLGRRSDGPQMERFLGPLQTLFANRFYFDPIYSALIVRPLEGLALIAALFDRYVIDGTVDAIAAIPVALGGIVRRSQSGLLQRYALAGVMGVLAMVVLLAWQLRS